MLLIGLCRTCRAPLAALAFAALPLAAARGQEATPGTPDTRPGSGAQPGTDAPAGQPAETDAAAAGGDAGHGSAGVRIGFYQNSDGGDGNPFLDEEETVIEPVIVFDYNVTDRLALNVQLSYDYVSSASIDRLSKFPQQSGASGDYYVGGDVGMRYRLTDDVRFGFHAAASVEYDYRSFGFGGDLDMDFNQKDTTIHLGVVGYLDTVDVIRFDGRQDEGTEDRTSFTANVGLYQILTPTLHGEIGYTLGVQSGFLETAFNAVVIESAALPPNPNLENQARGREVTEEVPDSRVRHAIHGRIRQYFETGTSIELGARFYTDDWGITSIAIEPRVYQWIVDDVLLVRVRWRYYTQTAADFYEDHFFAEEEDRTQDSDLGDFDSHTFGVSSSWHVTERQTLDLSLDYVIRSDGINQILAAIGWKLEF